MKRILGKSILLSSIITAGVALTATGQVFRHVTTEKSREAEKAIAEMKSAKAKEVIALLDSIPLDSIAKDTLVVRTASQIIYDTDIKDDIPTFNRLKAPWVFIKYRDIKPREKFPIRSYNEIAEEVWSNLPEHVDTIETLEEEIEDFEPIDSIAERQRYLDSLWGIDSVTADEDPLPEIMVEEKKEPKPAVMGNPRPAWLQNAMDAWTMQEDFMYSMIVEKPSLMDYTYWQLPVPPKLKEEEHGIKGLLKRAGITNEVKADNANIEKYAIGKKHWIHTVNAGLQFSQSYFSGNWYQGGNNYLSMLANFTWNVELNRVHHPKVLFTSSLQYRLGVNSTPDDQVHKYSISQDILQHNLNFGYNAIYNWYYSLTTQFKTQIFNNFPSNSDEKITSFLTPADFNLGLGMTYSKSNKKNTVRFNASIAPLSYNLKIAIDPDINHNRYGLYPTQKCKSAFGSNANLTLYWQMYKNITYNSRLYLFTDYKYGVGDWENTFNFQFTKWFSTQLFVHLRYDSSRGRVEGCSWNHWQLKEVLSIGLSYTFSSKG